LAHIGKINLLNCHFDLTISASAQWRPQRLVASDVKMALSNRRSNKGASGGAVAGAVNTKPPASINSYGFLITQIVLILL
jgi:hypothetical protein